VFVLADIILQAISWLCYKVWLLCTSVWICQG